MHEPKASALSDHYSHTVHTLRHECSHDTRTHTYTHYLLNPVDNTCSYQYIEQPPLYTMECNPYATRQLNLQCIALSRDGNFTIRWKWVPLFTQNIIPLQDVIQLSTSNSTNTFVVVSRLRVSSLSDSNSGTYWCQIVPNNANANPLLRSNVYYLLISAAYGELPPCSENIPLRRSVTQCADSGAQPQSRIPVVAVNRSAKAAIQTPLPTHANLHGSPTAIQTPLPTHANLHGSPTAVQTPLPTHANLHGSPTAVQIRHTNQHSSPQTPLPMHTHQHGSPTATQTPSPMHTHQHGSPTATQTPSPTHTYQHGSPTATQTPSPTQNRFVESHSPTHTYQHESPTAIQTPSPTHTIHHGSPTAVRNTSLLLTPTLTVSWHSVTSTVSLNISPSQILSDDMCITEFYCPRNDLLLIILVSFIILSVVVIGLLIACIVGFCYPKKVESRSRLV